MTLQQTGKLLILILGLTSHNLWADLVATVDRTIITNADLITLTVRASDDTADTQPDFSVLERDFEVVSISPKQNSRFTFENGRSTNVVYVDYVIVLAPKRMGELSIPELTAGRETTQPIPIRVQQQTNSQRQQMDQFVFFETSVDTNETYVQGQIIYSVKLFYTEAIGGDFPQPPVLPDTVVETIENERRYESIVNGKRYYVLEKRYALFPQRSGQIVIPRERFSGTRGRGGFFSQKQVVSAISDAHTVTVKRIPETFNSENWIPAKALNISESWTEAPPIFRVGEPVNRTIMISAVGLSNTVLPVIGDLVIPKAKVYADPPVTENRVGPDGLTALQVTTIGIVPTEEGRLDLPEIRVLWWNTETESEEVAVIPGATFNVLPATGVPADAPTVTAPVNESPQTGIARQAEPPYWQWLAIVLGALWLFTLWQWLVLRQQVRKLESGSNSRLDAVPTIEPDESQEYKNLKQACQRNRASDAHRQLFLWSKARFPHIDSVASLSREIPDLAIEISTLEEHLYAPNGEASWRGEALLKAVETLRKQKIAKPAKLALASELNPA